MLLLPSTEWLGIARSALGPGSRSSSTRRPSAAGCWSRSTVTVLSIPVDQLVGGGVVVGDRLRLAQLGDDVLGQHLAELHAPLVEGIDVPDRPQVKTLCS